MNCCPGKLLFDWKIGTDPLKGRPLVSPHIQKECGYDRWYHSFFMLKILMKSTRYEADAMTARGTKPC